MLNTAKGGVLGGNTKTPIKELQRIVAKYSNFIDFMNNDIQTYKTLHRRGLLNKLTSHLSRKNKRKYTDEDIIETALKCGSYKLFRKQYDNSKWQQAYRRNLLPKIKGLFKN